jgi:hypothetical protein
MCVCMSPTPTRATPRAQQATVCMCVFVYACGSVRGGGGVVCKLGCVACLYVCGSICGCVCVCVRAS